MPALVFGLLELGLRVGGYGYPTHFFVKTAGRDSFSTNQRFGWRFFPSAIARTPVLSELPAEKPADTYRIFALGGSAAMGTPEPTFSFGYMLQAMLSDRFPGTRFEVTNAAMTAINSHVVLPIAQDCAAMDPDLFVVYLGNNEVVGPYGPGTVFQGFSPNRSTIRWSIFVKSTRIGQLIGGVLGSEDGPTEWKGMEMFLENRVPADDPRLENVYDLFRANLSDVCDVAGASGAGTVLCTVAVNLKDCPPFASMHRGGLKRSERSEWEKQVAAGEAAADGARHAEAIEHFTSAAAIDDRYAELHFRLGQSCAELGRWDAARQHLAKARDLDALRFRADARINRTIRELAEDRSPDGVRLADAEAAFSQSELAPGGIPGEGLFYEHVHMTPEGNYLLAKTVFAQVVDLLPDAIRQRVEGSVVALPPQRCFELIGLSDWDRYRIAQGVMGMHARPPFTNQMDHADRHAAMRRWLNALRAGAMSRAALDEARRRCAAALDRFSDNLLLRANYAKLLQQMGEYDAAVEQWQALLSQFPDEAEWRVALGTVLKSQGKASEALAEFQRAGAIDSRFTASVAFNIGTVRLEQGQLEEAIEQFQRALAADPDSAPTHNSLGAARLRQGDVDQAKRLFRQAVKLDPDLADAQHNLGFMLQREGALQEAAECYRRALQADPGHLRTYPNLAAVLAKQGEPGEALAQYRRALEVAPENVELRYAFANLLVVQGRLAEAAAQFREVVRLEPDHVRARHNLAATLATLGEEEEAIGQYREVLRRQPDFAPARKALSRILGQSP